jgi:hypothetical protein
MALAPSWLISDSRPSSKLTLLSHFFQILAVRRCAWPCSQCRCSFAQVRTRISNLPKQESLSVFTQLHFHTVYSTANTERLPKCQVHTLNQFIIGPFPTDTVLLTSYVYWLWGGASTLNQLRGSYPRLQ